MGPDVNARQELTPQPMLICALCFLSTAYFTLNPRLFQLRLWFIPLTLASVWSLCTKYGFMNPIAAAWNFGLCSAGVTAAIRLIEMATLDEPPKYNGKPACLRRSVFCLDCVVNTLSYLVDLRCRCWETYGTYQAVEDPRRETSYSKFALDTMSSMLKHVIYIDMILAFLDNMNGGGLTMYRSTLAITQNYSIHLPHPLLGAIPLAMATGLLVRHGLELEHYAIALLITPLAALPPSISPYPRSPSALKSEWPRLFDHPSRATSLRDFWAKRWQTIPQRGFVVAGGRPGRAVGRSIGQLIGRLVGREKDFRVASARVGFVMGVFLVSGLMHDLGMWGMGQGTDFRRVTGFFVIQGVGILVEEALGLVQSTGKKQDEPTANGHLSRSLPSSSLRLYLMRLWVYVWVLAPGTMLTDAWLSRGFDLVTLIPKTYSPSMAIFAVWNRFAFG